MRFNDATFGSGPLLQRDYWAVLGDCPLRPSEVAELVAIRFTEFPPEELARFRRQDGRAGALEVGEELDISIMVEGEARVVVLHRDRQSVTIGTLLPHPEAGRITFGAYRNADGEVVFHIRSRARTSSPDHYVKFLAGGESMQTSTWTDFIDRLAHTVGSGVRGVIHAETRTVELDRDEDRQPAPTFLARGD